MKPRNIRFAMALLVPSVLAGCVTTTPEELVDARTAYRQAAAGPAKDYAPSQLDVAKKALDRAESYFDNQGDEAETRDMAYIAQRLSQIAEANAQVQMAEREKTRAERELEVAQSKRQHQTEQALLDTKEELARKDAETQFKEKELQNTEQNLQEEKRNFEQEKLAREAAEQKVLSMREELSKVGEVKEEARGLVVNISGSLLFASGKSALLPAAENNLTTLANTVSTSDQKIIIEGHTDSVGSDSSNHALSVARAESVKAFLVTHGVPSDRIEAVGLGESRPISDNSTPEGRANNRRVEIVIEQRPTS